jgi:hypothetical protein
VRNLTLRRATIVGVLAILGACADLPTRADQQRAPDLPAQDAQVQGCVSDGLCPLPPISGGWCEPWMELDWDCDDGGGECEASVGDPSDPEGAVSVQSCPGGGDGDTGGGGGVGGGGGDGGSGPGTVCPTSDTGSCPEPVCEIDCPAEEEEFDSDICPQPLRGRTVTTLIDVAGRNHEFQFTGRMNRVNPLMGRSPASYTISGPTLSEDGWWIAESGTIQLVCWGRWRFRNSLWVGSVFVQATDLHMVMAPGHPDF